MELSAVLDRKRSSDVEVVKIVGFCGGSAIVVHLDGSLTSESFGDLKVEN